MATEIRSGIPTTYEASRFRSRLEARWAAFFDLIGWSWIYEPLDADGYIPDFLLTGAYPTFVEVGPCITLVDYKAKAAKANRVAGQLGHDLIVVGVSPLPDLTGLSSGRLALGWLGEHQEGTPAHLPSECLFCDHVHPEIGAGHCDHGPWPAGFVWDVGVWGECEGLSFYHTSMDYRHRPCGNAHEQPVDLAGDAWRKTAHSDRDIERLWREAGNVVQWQPR